jgi:hypothetical protein
MAKFNIYYFKHKDAKIQSHKEFKLHVFPSLRLSV